MCGRVSCPEVRYIATSYALSDGGDDGGSVFAGADRGSRIFQTRGLELRIDCIRRGPGRGCPVLVQNCLFPQPNCGFPQRN